MSNTWVNKDAPYVAPVTQNVGFKWIILVFDFKKCSEESPVLETGRYAVAMVRA